MFCFNIYFHQQCPFSTMVPFVHYYYFVASNLCYNSLDHGNSTTPYFVVAAVVSEYIVF